MSKRLICLLLLSTLIFLLMGCSGDSNDSKLVEYQLTVVVTDGEGSVNPSEGTFKKNESVTLKAIPAEGWCFKEWGGDLSGTSPEVELVMDSDKNITASFEEIIFLQSIGDKSVEEGGLLEFTVSTSEDFNGAITVNGDTAPGSGDLAQYFDSTTTSFSWTPTYDDFGSYQLTFTAEQTGLTDSETITITVENVLDISTVAGTGDYGYNGDNIEATTAQLKRPFDVAVDTIGNIYIADDSGHRIRKIDTNGIITTVAGTGTAGDSGEGNSAEQACLNCPRGIAVDISGNIFIADYLNNKVKKVDTQGLITTIAGTGTDGDSGDGGLAINADLNAPSDIVVDSAGNVYIADSGNNKIRRIDTEGIISTIAGDGIDGDSGDEGPAIDARLTEPVSLALDSAENLYIADPITSKIKKVDREGIITTVAGSGSIGYSGDGRPATDARLDHPRGVSIDSIGNLYITDTINHVIRKVDTEGIITTIAGTPEVSGFSGDGGPAVDAKLHMPTGLIIDSEGVIYFADTFNYRLRKID